jgi:hypothetical protein
MPDAPFCLLEGCDRPAHRRGLCKGHWRMALARIRQGKTSWHTLEVQGLAGPPEPGFFRRQRP